MLPHTFETARLLLRPVTVVDVDAIFDSYAQDELVARYLIWRPHRRRSETQAYVERCIATPSEVERTYMLVGREDNIVRGAFALRQRASHRLDCGYVLARRWWRHGLMTEVLTEIAAWALRQASSLAAGRGPGCALNRPTWSPVKGSSARVSTIRSGIVADSGGSRPRIRDDVARQSDLMSLGVPR